MRRYLVKVFKLDSGQWCADYHERTKQDAIDRADAQPSHEYATVLDTRNPQGAGAFKCVYSTFKA